MNLIAAQKVAVQAARAAGKVMRDNWHAPKKINASEAHDIKLELDDKAKDFLVEKGYDTQYGARPMRRAVERFLEDPLAEEILRGSLQPGEPILVTSDKEKLVFNPKAAAEGAVAG